MILCQPGPKSKPKLSFTKSHLSYIIRNMAEVNPFSVTEITFNAGYQQTTNSVKGSGMPELTDSRLMLRTMVGTKFASIIDHYGKKGMTSEAEQEELTSELAAAEGPEVEQVFEEGFSMPVYRISAQDVKSNPRVVPEKLLEHAWTERVRKVNGVIQISGGAAGLELPEFPSTQSIIDRLDRRSKDTSNAYALAEVLYDEAARGNLGIVTGGTQSGIMQAISAVHIHRETRRALPARGVEEYADTFDSTRRERIYEALELPLLVQIFPGQPAVIEGKKPEDYAEYIFPVAPGSFGFMIDGVDFGGEAPAIEQSCTRIGYVPALERLTSQLQETSGHEKRRIITVINGGLLTLDEIDNATTPEPKASVILFEGTGRSADKLARMLRDDNLPADQFAEEEPGDKDLRNPQYVDTLQRVAAQLRLMRDEGSPGIEIIDVRQPYAARLTRGTIGQLLK